MRLSETQTGHFEATNGTAKNKSVEQSKLKLTYAPKAGEPRTSSMSGDLGPAGLGFNPLDHSYTCNTTTLTFKFTAFKLTFKRQGGATREIAASGLKELNSPQNTGPIVPIAAPPEC
jgi:hypothetical protein